MEIPLLHMDQPLYRLLQDSFPSDSDVAEEIQQCQGKGYVALKTIVRKIHPNYQLQPAIMIKSYPTQGSRPLQEYFMAVKDFLQLRSFIMNLPQTLNNPQEVDVFISNMKYSDYIQ